MNMQHLLRFLLKRRLSGITDDAAYSGDALSADAFHKKHATTLGKVEGGKLRERLQKYYAIDGRTDACVICIPEGPYRPHVYYNQNLFPALNDQAAQHVWNAKAGMNKRTPASHALAFRYLDLALQQHPNHLRILAR